MACRSRTLRLTIDMTHTFNPYKEATLQSNWYEERFFHANTRRDPFTDRTRSRDDEIENTPRVTRKVKPTGEVFCFTNEETPDEHYLTTSRKTYVHHPPNFDTLTARRLNTAPEKLRDILSARPSRYICDHSLPYRSPEKHFKTQYRKAYIRYI
jgi:hypothetical protein